MMNEITLDTKLVGEITGNFIIPAYQRGYRWTDETKMLLDDIDEIPESKNYCLQPVVVKKIGENDYELIDGQQRLTTLFLIFKYIMTFRPKLKQKYSIDYKIRKNSKEILLNLDFDNINENPANIDEYFINNSAKTIKKWFYDSGDDDNKASLIADKLNNRVRVIWYEINASEDARSIFTRLNIGKIPLTNAELVKAVFLSKNNGIDDRYQLEICSQWDGIERELQDDAFWKFITNHNANSFPTRIELLFNLMASKQDEDKERFRTFFWFLEQTKTTEFKDNKIGLWKLVIENFQRLKEWFYDSELYHKIGYLIAVSQKPLQILIKESSQMTKTEFRNSLNGYISDSIKSEKKLEELSYENDYDIIEKILLLFNVLTVSKSESMRFPFDKHKENLWSLEHIHAQQSQGLNTKDKWNEWLEFHIKALKNINADKNLITEIEQRDKENITKEIFDMLFDRVVKIFNYPPDYIHSLSNLALLGRDENSALNNSVFDVKRDKIIEMDKNGCYIPLCTRRVFLKYYTQSDENQIHFWSEKDRTAYFEAIKTTLKPYLQ